MLSNKLLEALLNKAGYYQCPTTPGLWRHKWRPTLFCLIVDDFGIEYVNKRHADHLRDTLLKHYEITQEGVAQVVGVAFVDVFVAKVVNN